MKMIFLTTQYNNATGGTKYDKEFIDHLVDLGEDIKVIDDSYFNEQGDRHFYNKRYGEIIRELADADVFITNSRLYTRLDGIVKAIRKENPNIKIVAFHHHFNFMTQRGILRTIHKKLELQFLNSLDFVIYASGYIYELSKKYVKIRGYLAEVITKEARISNSIKSGHSLLYVGSIEKRKGLTYLLKAFVKICDIDANARLSIVGSGSNKYEDKLKRYINKKGILNKVIFEGRVSEERKIELFNSADVFVFPSLLEGLGLVIREAMSYGLPVVAFDNTAMGYTVKDNYNGLLAKNKDSNSLFSKTMSLLRDDELRKQISDGAKESAKNFGDAISFNKNIESVLNTLKEISYDNH